MNNIIFRDSDIYCLGFNEINAGAIDSCSAVQTFNNVCYYSYYERKVNFTKQIDFFFFVTWFPCN